MTSYLWKKELQQEIGRRSDFLLGCELPPEMQKYIYEIQILPVTLVTPNLLITYLIPYI